MVTSFFTYLSIGFKHLIGAGAIDHALFLLLLCAPFNSKNWKPLLLLLSLFTIGHTASMLLVLKFDLSVSTHWIELLIAATILISGVYRVFQEDSVKSKAQYYVTALFGCIHGLGFGSDLRGMIPEKSFWSSVCAFFLGLEAAQIIEALVFVFTIQSITKLIGWKQSKVVIVISVIIVIFAFKLISDRW